MGTTEHGEVKRRHWAASLALVGVLVFVIAVAKGAVPLLSNDVPEVGVEVYFEPGAGELSTLAEADLVVTGEVTDVGESRWSPETSATPWKRDLIDVYHPVKIRIDRVLGSNLNRTSLPVNGSTVTVRVFGGRIYSDAEANDTDAARFEENEQALVFLNRVGNSSHYRVQSFHCGKFTVRRDTALRPRIGSQYRKEIPVQEIVDTVKQRTGRPTESGR